MCPASIHEAARTGDADLIRKLLASEPSLVNQDDEHQWRPVFHAALNRHLEVVRTLIEFGADLSAHDGYVMHYAGEVPNNKPVVEVLLIHGALDSHTEPQSDLARQLIHAVFLANVPRVKALLQTHPSLSREQYARGDTALHHASRNGDIDIVRTLLDHGAMVNARNHGGDFPLYCAAGHGHAETTTVLLENRADAAMTMKDGNTVGEWLHPFSEHDARYRKCLDILSQYEW